MAFERRPGYRPAANDALDLLQTLLETPAPPPDARLSPRTALQRSSRAAAAGDAVALLQALLETPLAPPDGQLRPVVLHPIDIRRRRGPSRPPHTWFDTLLHRSSQFLLVAALLVLGYWFANGPVRGWLHDRRAPSARASGAVPRAAASRVPAANTAIPPPNSTPDGGWPSPPSTVIVPRPSASGTSIAAIPTAGDAAPQATSPVTIGEQLEPTVQAAAAVPSAAPQQAAPPPIPPPSSPTITPVLLGVAASTAVPTPSPGSGQGAAPAPPTRLIVPLIALDTPVVEVFIVDDAWQVAEYAAGYLNGSGLPGLPGNLALDGHAGLFGGVFANLGALNPGDDIYVDAAGVRYHYRVRESKAVRPNQIEVLDSTETPTLTLLTCTNWDTQRLVVVADFVESGPAIDA